VGWGGEDYSIYVDYFFKTGRSQLTKIENIGSRNIEQKRKKIFSRFGIPIVLVAENMPFNSFQFRLFAREWTIQINT